jgi:hypothetical protein
MKKLLRLGFLLVVFMGITSMAMADTFTTDSCNVNFAVNDGGFFYVKNSQIPPAGSSPGVDASSSISGSNFHLTATATPPSYSDSGIVLYFNGGLTLGDLQSVSVTSTGGPVYINLWLDTGPVTGGDGTFFAFTNNIMTGLNGDSYGSDGSSVDASTSFYMMGGNGAGSSYTLAQLQAGVVSGIDSNTPAALWIGITNSGSGPADISSVTVRVARESVALQAGGDRLAATQNTDGGWGWPLTGTSQQNTIGPIAMGLAKAYLNTGSASQLTALQNAGTFLSAKTNTFSPPDGYLAAELDQIFGGNTYKNHVKTYYYDKLAAGTYQINGVGTSYTTATYVAYIRSNRESQGIPNLAAWDLGMGLVGAASCGASTSDWIAGVKAEINELDGNSQYDVIGLAGAIYGLAFVGEDFDPTSGEHAAASNLNDLAHDLSLYQINNGGFADNKNNVSPGHESNQETSYAILALNEVNRSTYLNNIQGASNYLITVQVDTGGWNNESGGNPADENNEVTGEALWGISTAYTLTNIQTETGGSSYCQPAVEFEARIGQGGLSGDWELGHKYNGSYIDTSGQFAWQNNVDVPFTLTHNPSTGTFTLSLECGPSTTWNSGHPGEGVTAIWVVAKSSDVNYTSTIDNLSLNGTPIAGPLIGNNNWNNMRIYGELMSNFTLTGTINFSWTSGTPQHSQIEAMFSVILQSEDSDGDGYASCDNCPNDPLKIDPGVCGCGVPDTDTDSDGTPDCTDGCPNDPLKIAPGVCGCGVADTDSDGDGVANCIDGCPNDPNKTAPGVCGCGVPDTDTDSDGTPDCTDGCPNDPLKIAPGVCGCGVADTDSDGDGVANCIDNCPYVSNPSQQDTDGDGIGDACDTALSPVRIVPSPYHTAIQDAFIDSALTDQGTIQAQDYDFTESPTFNRVGILATLKGGYNSDFSDNQGHYTRIHGLLTIQNGTLVVENIVIQ